MSEDISDHARYLIFNQADSDKNIQGRSYTLGFIPAGDATPQELQMIEVKSYKGVAVPLDEADHALTMRRAFILIMEHAFQNGNLHNMEVVIHVHRPKLAISSTSLRL